MCGKKSEEQCTPPLEWRDLGLEKFGVLGLGLSPGMFLLIKIYMYLD